MLKNDRWINEQAAHGLLEPFQPTLVRHLDPENRSGAVLSIGIATHRPSFRVRIQRCWRSAARRRPHGRDASARRAARW